MVIVGAGPAGAGAARALSGSGLHILIVERDDVTEEVWDRTYDCIIKGPFFLTKLVIPHMQKQGGGSILFTSTSSAGTATPTDPHYVTAKS